MIEWLNAAIESVLAGWRELPSKDALSLAVSMCSFVIAIASFGYVIRSRRRDATTAARNDLHSCIAEISKLRTEREEKERQLGEKFHTAEHATIRASLNDRMKLYLSKAVLLSTRYRKLDLTSFDNLLLGAALADEGKYRTSLRFHQRAVKTSADAADKAAALRLYGEALIASGRPRRGRRRMRKAANIFRSLSRTRGYDEDKMNYESAQTYARLIQTQMRWNYRSKTRTDLIDFNRSISRIKDRVHRHAMEEVFAGITGSRRAAAEPAPAVAAEVSTVPAAVPAAANETGKAEPQVDAPVSSVDDDAGRSWPVVSTAEMDIVSALPRTADLEQTSSIGR
jgi:tetratricopeptide (TPR) repeat protein